MHLVLLNYKNFKLFLNYQFILLWTIKLVLLWEATEKILVGCLKFRSFICVWAAILIIFNNNTNSYTDYQLLNLYLLLHISIK